MRWRPVLLWLVATVAVPGLAGAQSAGVAATSLDDGKPRQWQVLDTADRVNLRAAPSTSSAILGRFKAGTTLTGLGCQMVQERVWCNVYERAGGPRGYIAAEYLQPVVTPGEPVGSISPARTRSLDDVPASPEQGGPRYWEVEGVSDSLNLRREPSISSGILGNYARGSILDNLGCQKAGDRVWCQVRKLDAGPRGYVSAEFLKPAAAPDGSVPSGVDDSAARASLDTFDASGKVPCVEPADQHTVLCDFAVARGGGGVATVVITHPDGAKRTLLFALGRLREAATSRANGDAPVTGDNRSGLYQITVGDVRYQILDGIIFGG